MASEEFIGNIRVIVAGQGEDVMLLHSAGTPPEGMLDHIDLLSPHCRVSVPSVFDLARETADTSFHNLATKLDEIVDNLGFRSGIVAGCSVGGALALSYAANFPDKVKSVIACDPVGWPLGRNYINWARELYLITREAKRSAKEQGLKRPGFSLFIRELTRNPKGALRVVRLSATADIREDLPKINAPVKMLWCEQDRFVPFWSGEKMTEQIPNATIKKISYFNHYWYNFYPNLLVEYVLGNLNSQPEANNT